MCTSRSHQSTASPWGSFAEAMFKRVRVLGQPRSPLASSRSKARRRGSDVELGSPFDDAAVSPPLSRGSATAPRTLQHGNLMLQALSTSMNSVGLPVRRLSMLRSKLCSDRRASALCTRFMMARLEVLGTSAQGRLHWLHASHILTVCCAREVLSPLPPLSRAPQQPSCGIIVPLVAAALVRCASHPQLSPIPTTSCNTSKLTEVQAVLDLR
jgi:hypothetical protein